MQYEFLQRCKKYPLALIHNIQVCLETVAILFILLLSLPFSVCRWFVIQFAYRFRNDLGKILSHLDIVCDNEHEASVDVDCSKHVSQNSVLFTLVLDGILKLSDLQYNFKMNVINTEKYTQLQQYPTNFMGYRFWKQDESFILENHVVQENFEGSLSNLHENLLNRPFLPKRSPWELVLIQNKENKQTILGFRISHTMSDAKSAMKLLFNHLGQKPFNQEAVGKGKTLSLPFKIIKTIPTLISLVNTAIRGRNHPWKNYNFDDNQTPYSVTFSNPLSLPDIKAIAKKNNASGSSVIMAAITGAIHNLQEATLRRKTLCMYPLPKENHPDTEMKNHFYTPVVSLPTRESCPKKRLAECHQRFINLRKNHNEKLQEVVLVSVNLPGPVRKYLPKNQLAPMIITNNVGAKEEFEIGGFPVVKLCGSFALLEGTVGVGFFTLSYGDELNISVIAKGNTISRKTLNKLAEGIGTELEILKGL
ncbi:unnamed protein product [Orchesella dallaii]|uniref:O-acyltransferase WSD1 C-terminal domain-containing protein n=1 Tax=Orchesella dallaii TaxID=48710 RepID=A0ABP1RJW9_9HEXA